jgi:hypothetical protein
MSAATINDMWIYLAGTVWTGTDLRELDNAPADTIIAAVNDLYPGGADKFVTDHPAVTS